MCTYAQEKIEMFPFGNMDSWAVRRIKESLIIGGDYKSLYMIAPKDSVNGIKPVPKWGASPWGSSNAYAKVMGVETVSVTVKPEKRGSGYCCKMQTELQSVSSVGLDIKTLVTGSIYTGRLIVDPVTLEYSSKPNSAIDMGVPFKKRPKALILDYKAQIMNSGIVFANATASVTKKSGKDAGQILLFLQHRWEENGHIYAYRVGTATEHITHSTSGWINNHRLNIRYGDISKQSGFQPWEKLTKTQYRARNKQGRMVYIEERGFRNDVEPTHIIIMVSSGSQDPFSGCPGNTVWCDNIRLAY